MSYITSGRIGSFPTTKRGSINKLVTENSLTRLINRLIDVDGYVITSEIDDSAVNYEEGIPAELWNIPLYDFEFSIRGYYFCITADSVKSGLQHLIDVSGFRPVSGTSSVLYGNIFIDKTNKNYPELWGQDSVDDASAVCKAIQFTIDDETPVYPEDYDSGNYNLYTVPLVQWDQNKAGSWLFSIPSSMAAKFNSKSITDIDGGEIVL